MAAPAADSRSGVRHLLEIADDVVWMTAGTTHGLGAPHAAAVHDQFRREYLGPVD